MSFTPSVEGIASILKSGRLIVPEYQRSFSWEETEVVDLWDDIEGAIKGDVPEYFLGSIVLSKATSGDLEVIDGQQRLATVSLLIAAIVDLFDSRTDERAGEIRRDFLGKKDVVTRQITQNIRLNAHDNELFRQLTLLSPSDRDVRESRESHTLLKTAFRVLKERLATELQDLGPDDWQRPLLRWYQFLDIKATVLKLVAEDESRAFVIFETLNARGINLNTADLLRNHVFGMAGSRLGEAREAWARGFSAVSPDGIAEQSETFLKHYWASRSGVVRVKGLYKTLKPAVTDPQTAISFVQDIADAGPIWAGMYDRDSQIWTDHPPGTLAALEVLKRLKVEQCRPLLLATLGKFDPEEAKLVTIHVMNWSVRWIVSGGGGGGTVERLYATTAKKVNDGALTTAKEIVEELRDDVPNDAIFKRSFAAKTINSGWLARYFLRALERTNSGDGEPELVPNENVEEVNLEHVLPKNPVQEWLIDNFTEEEAKAHVLLMGNQALLRKTHNRRIGNKPFSDKQPILVASDFALTKEIGAHRDWTAGRIVERGQQLAELAVRTWPRG